MLEYFFIMTQTKGITAALDIYIRDTRVINEKIKSVIWTWFSYLQK